MKQIPNFLTSLRVFMAMVFPMAPTAFHGPIILAALASEFLDGYLARKFNAVSDFGKVFDPVADKMFFLSVTLTWLAWGILSWIELGLLAAREIGIVLILLIFPIIGYKKLLRATIPTYLGKLTTVLQYLAFATVLWLGYAIPLVVFLTAGFGIVSVFQYAMTLLHPEWSEEETA